MAGTSALDDPDDRLAPPPADELDWQPSQWPNQWQPGQWPGQSPGPRSSRRKVLVGVVAAIVVSVALMIALPEVFNAARSAANQPTSDQLRPGDCLTGTNMDLPGSDPWPVHVTRVPCTKPHVAEVYFASDLWPQSEAYPGEDDITSEVDTRCESEFATFDGVDLPHSRLSYSSVSPLVESAWDSGSRRAICVAYIPSKSGPSGGALVSYSFKGRKL